jgi:DNA-nicking Smr family endonuclease
MAGRHLSPDEVALWQRVAGTVRRSKNAPVNPLPVRPERIERRSFPATEAAKKDRTSTSSVRTVSNIGVSNTLDGSWDKRIAGGRIVPERTIDLHGLNLAGAHARLEHGLAAAARDGVRVVLLVTGRPARSGASRIDIPLRGIIRESVGDWLASSRISQSIAAVQNAHPRHGGAGALYIVLRRAR